MNTFKAEQTNLLNRRSRNYLGTVPNDTDGEEFIQCLRILLRSHNADLGIHGRNPNRKQWVGWSMLYNRHFSIDQLRRSLPMLFSTRFDLYFRDTFFGQKSDFRIPKYHLMSLEELQKTVENVYNNKQKKEDEMLLGYGINPIQNGYRMLQKDINVILKLISEVSDDSF